jgi:hypothetical protein
MNIKQDGFKIFKSLFSISEVEFLRDCLTLQVKEDYIEGKIGYYKAGGVFGIGDLMSKRNLKFIIDKIRPIANEILDGDALYFGDSMYTKGLGQRGFHRDNVDRAFNEGDDWNSPYDLIRFGIYLQDHSKHSGGLEVIKGTHNISTGTPTFVESEIGDLVVWNMRLLHSGNAVRYKFNSKVSVTQFKGYEYLIPKFLTYPEEKERGALFISFGKDGNHLNRYINNHLLARQDMRQHLLASGFDLENISKEIILKKYQ